MQQPNPITALYFLGGKHGAKINKNRTGMYNRKNILRRILWVQEITLEHTRKGVTQQWVYDNIINPRFSISIRTYYSYLATNAKAEMRKLQPETTNKAVQMAMF